MTDEKIFLLVNELATALHNKLDTVIDNQGKQEVKIELIKNDIRGNGSIGIKDQIKENKKQIELLKSKPEKDKVQKTTWGIACFAVLLTVVNIILNLAGVI